MSRHYFTCILRSYTVDHLINLYQRASLEARADVEDQTIFGTHLGRFIDGLKEYTTGMVGNGIFSFNGQLQKVRSKEDYMAIRSKTVYRPIHLNSKATMAELVELVKENFEAQQDIEKRIFGPWRAILANFLTNPSALQAIYDVKELHKGKLFKLTPLDSMEKKLKKIYNPTKSQPTDSFGNLYRNSNEWTDTCRTMVKLNEEAIKFNFADIISQAEEINELASKLADNIFNNPDDYQVSNSAMDLLTEGSYLIGKELEFLGATGSMMDSISGAIASTADVLKK